jgi:hypothetical protein
VSVQFKQDDDRVSLTGATSRAQFIITALENCELATQGLLGQLWTATFLIGAFEATLDAVVAWQGPIAFLKFIISYVGTVQRR